MLNFRRQLRDILLANAVNGTACVSRSPPYSHTVDTLFTEETERITERFLPAVKKRSSIATRVLGSGKGGE